MVIMKMSKSYFPKLMDSILLRKTQWEGKWEEIPKRRAVPVSIYRYLMTNNYPNKPISTEILFSKKEILTLEKMFLELEISRKGFFSKISIATLRNIWGEYYKEKFLNTLQKRITFIKNGTEVIFQLASTILLSDSEVKIELSKEAQLLYLSDYLLPEQLILDIKNESDEVQPYIRYLMSYYRHPENGIRIETLLCKVSSEKASPSLRATILWQLEQSTFGFLVDTKTGIVKYSDHSPSPMNAIEYANNLKLNLKPKFSKKIVQDANIDYKKIAKEMKLDDEEIEKQYVLFVNYYSSQKKKAINWGPLWENWIIRGKTYNKANPSGTQIEGKENEQEYYKMIQADKDIREILAKRNIDINEIVSGQIRIEEVALKTINIPKRIGKGDKIVFYWVTQMENTNV